VDGTTHSGCGNADYVSRVTNRQVRVTKTSGGASAVVVTLRYGTHSQRGSVMGTGHSVRISGTTLTTG
jgi:hypothetical protein